MVSCRQSSSDCVDTPIQENGVQDSKEPREYQGGPIFLPPRQPSPWARSLIDEALRQAAQSSPDRAVA